MTWSVQVLSIHGFRSGYINYILLFLASSLLLTTVACTPAPSDPSNPDEDSLVDADGDGVPAPDDCDDQDASLSVPSTWHADADGDGFGDPDAVTEACQSPADHVADGTDCDDQAASINPDATEVCDGVDNDCNEQVDEDDPGLDPASYLTAYPDADGDGYGVDSEMVEVCEVPPDYAAEAGDCDDADLAVYPGAPELCDGKDTDCDGVISDAGLAAYQTPDGRRAALTTLATGSSSAAVSYAAEEPGVLLLCQGTWYAQLNLRADVEVVAPFGPEATIIDGAASGTVVRVGADVRRTVALRGVTIRNGAAENGGGLLAINADVTLDDVVIEANVAEDFGGGAYISRSTLTATGVTWTGNSSDRSGGALRMSEGSSATLTDVVMTGNSASRFGGAATVKGSTLRVTGDSRITENDAPQGGAILVEGTAGKVELDDIEVSRNRASHTGGGVRVDEGASLVLDGTTFEANTQEAASYANGGGGVSCHASSRIEASDAEFTDNVAGTYGGAVWSEGCDLTWTGGSFTGSRARRGGAVSLDDASTASFSGVRFAKNETTDDGGGAVRVRASSATFESSCVFEDNTARRSGGALAVLYGAEVEVDDATFTGSTAGTNGGAVLVDESELTLTDVTFEDSRSAWTGSSFSEGSGGGTINASESTLTLTDVDMSGGRAGRYGGHALFAFSEVVWDKGVIDGGRAGWDGGNLFVYGSGSSVELSNLTITDGLADRHGGGLAAARATEVTLTSCTLKDNVASEAGGALFVEDSRVDLTSPTLTDNTADRGGALTVRNLGTAERVKVTGSTRSGNARHDVYHDDLERAYDSLGASFTCDGDGCE